MNERKRLAVIACICSFVLFTPSRHSIAVQDAEVCAALVDRQRAALVIRLSQGDRSIVCGGKRAASQLVPTSTFKIAHALIALQEAAIEGPDQLFPWDGLDRNVSIWNRDTTVSDAIANSTVWVFQKIAGQIGFEGERDGVKSLRYGNQNVGEPGDLKHFWLSGPLKISALEQIEFLERLRNRTLPADPIHQADVIDMLLLFPCGDGCSIYGKTGAMLPIDDDGRLQAGRVDILPESDERTGWFVGWLERSETAGGPVFFAHNIDLDVPGAMAAREAVVFNALRILGVDEMPTGER